jgi:membrane protease YdiL (CAAX protease family)
MAARVMSSRQAAFAVVLAFALWGIVFGLRVVNFWLGISLAAALLAGLGAYWGGLPFSRKEITLRHTGVALGSAAMLYGIFAVGRLVSVAFLPFAPEQINTVYALRAQADSGLIALILCALTSPCEEIFWRASLQRWAMDRHGPGAGWLAASFLYAGVHVVSGNFMLTGAALTAGLFWGALYMRTRSLYVCAVSHAAWTVTIFLLRPLPA